MGERCEIRTLADGRKVRVNGSIDQETLEVLGEKVRLMVEAECKAVSDVPMPEIAQCIHKRAAYWCRMPFGHDGPHKAGGNEWTDPLTCPSECMFLNHPGREHEDWVASRSAPAALADPTEAGGGK